MNKLSRPFEQRNETKEPTVNFIDKIRDIFSDLGSVMGMETISVNPVAIPHRCPDEVQIVDQAYLEIRDL